MYLTGSQESVIARQLRIQDGNNGSPRQWSLEQARAYIERQGVFLIGLLEGFNELEKDE
jgi:hypothetical protein